ncbi:hypothetical protein MASR2M8_05060 [Opitutaceae bacterium]
MFEPVTEKASIVMTDSSGDPGAAAEGEGAVWENATDEQIAVASGIASRFFRRDM